MGRTSKKSESYLHDKRMIDIRDNYFHCGAALRSKLRISDSLGLARNVYEEYISDVEKAMLLLDPIDRKILKNEFFYSTNKVWWIGEYSRTTFYRLRRKAIDSFLRIFNEE